MLELIEPRRLLGSGSNGAVLEVVLRARTHPALDPSTPVGRPLALKVASHFWSDGARELLECERRVLDALPPHRGVIRMYAAFVDIIPEHVRRLLPPEMSEVVRAQRPAQHPAYTAAPRALCAALRKNGSCGQYLRGV